MTIPLRKKKSLPVGAALLASTLILTGASPAKANLNFTELKDAVSYIKSAIAPFQTANAVVGVLKFLNIVGAGPSLADKLDRVETRLVAEIQFWMDVQLDAATFAAFAKYEAVLRNPGQTSSNRERILFLTGASSSNDASDVLFEMERLILDNRDIERSMQLTVPYNALAVVMGQAMIFHDKYFPEESPYSWYTFNDHFGRVFNADYQVIKASRIQCSPGYNPNLADLVVDHDAVFESSRLYRKRENRSFGVGTFMCRGSQRNVSYNPVTSTLSAGCPQSPQSIVIDGQGFPSFNQAAKDRARARARALAQSEFRTADDVAALRDAQTQLRFASGGDEFNGVPGVLNNGDFFDPWVVETELCPNTWNQAYVQRP